MTGVDWCIADLQFVAIVGLLIATGTMKITVLQLFIFGSIFITVAQMVKRRTPVLSPKRHRVGRGFNIHWSALALIGFVGVMEPLYVFVLIPFYLMGLASILAFHGPIDSRGCSFNLLGCSPLFDVNFLRRRPQREISVNFIKLAGEIAAVGVMFAVSFALVIAATLICDLIGYSKGDPTHRNITHSFDVVIQVLQCLAVIVGLRLLPIFPLEGARCYRGILRLFGANILTATKIVSRVSLLMLVAIGFDAILYGGKWLYVLPVCLYIAYSNILEVHTAEQIMKSTVRDTVIAQATQFDRLEESTIAVEKT